MDRWCNKLAVVTGASAGIGAAVCIALADAGVDVVGLARRTLMVDKLQSEVKGTGKIHSLQCDVSKSEEVGATFRAIEARYGGIHVLVNNAGVLHQGHITAAGDKQITEDQLISTIDVNLKAPVLCARHAVASMKKHDIDGHIVIINSIAGHYLPFMTEFNVYPATKHGVTAFTSMLNSELATFKNRIKTTSLSPGLVATDLVGKAVKDQPHLKPKEVANAVLYALSTPPHFNITELSIMSVTELRL